MTKTYSSAPTEGVDLANGVSFLWRLRWWLLAGLVVGAIIGYAASYAFPKRYTVTTRIMPNAVQGASSLASLASVVGVALPAGIGRSADNEGLYNIAVLQSDRFLLDFIKGHGFADHLLRTSEREKGINRLTDFELLKRARRVLDINQDRIDNIISISATYRDPNIAAEWVRRIIPDANRLIAREMRQQLQGNIVFLRQRIASEPVAEVRNNLTELLSQQLQELMLAHNPSHYAFRIIDPPVVTDMDDFQFPNRPLFGGLGAVVGLLAGIVVGRRYGRVKPAAASLAPSI